MILDTLAAASKKRAQAAKETVSLGEMREKALSMPRGDLCFQKALSGGEFSFICEVKRASPSKGVIAQDFPYLAIAREYEQAGAAAISVLTEPQYFLGSDEYLRGIRGQVRLPLLRKDFTVDEYQIYEAKTLGADAVLLICAILSADEIRRYLDICAALGLSALVEAHDEGEIEMALKAGAAVIGVNNRDLKTFTVDLGTCLRLRGLVPPDIAFVAESGIKTAEDVALLKSHGISAALIGETLMRSGDKRSALAGLRGGAL
jgi:indole-3-glycerol phosphate synthase